MVTVENVNNYIRIIGTFDNVAKLFYIPKNTGRFDVVLNENFEIYTGDWENRKHLGNYENISLITRDVLGAAIETPFSSFNEANEWFSKYLSGTPIATGEGGVSVQNPLPVDGDSVYCKDIDVSRSDIGSFTGSVCDPFSDLHSENVDNSANNPKSILIHFNRTIVATLVGIGSSEGGTFSNVKVIGILSGNIETVLSDHSGDSILKTTQAFSFPNAGLNAVRIEFHTVNQISITNIYIPKIRVVATIPQTSIIYGTSYKSPYMLNGGSQDMAVDGSIIPVDFSYIVSGFSPGRWVRNFFDLQDGTQDFQPENFGAIVGGLDNGVQIISLKDGIETIMETWKTNMDISMTCYDFNSPYKAGAYIGRWTITSDLGGAITMFPGDGIIIRIPDDLTGLDAFRFRAKIKQ